ncbi:MAG: MoxR family ATPase [Acidobacteriota bacterium]|jgi:MoxR-like ATPase
MHADLDRLLETFDRARAEVGKVIVGQERVVDLSLVAVFTGSHALVEGVPGIAKTLLVRSLAKVLGCDFGRIQFTPDLMPTDITGTNVFNMRDSSFQMARGPVFTTFLLADEINRAPAKTQAALLQAMQERKVTIDRETYPLGDNFTVFATQNPIEYEGTYPLPEAQKDRFMVKISMSYPDRSDELTLAARTLGEAAPERVLASSDVRSVVTPEDLGVLKETLELIHISQDLVSYAVDLVRKTRTQDGFLVGAGPRATQALLLASRAQAALEGRDFMTPDDVKAMAFPVLEHRLILRPEFEIEGATVKEVLAKMMEEVPVPR